MALFSFVLVPVAIGFAVLRYRLFEIDVIIQKTPVYATLVAILATLYLSGIAGLGWIARGCGPASPPPPRRAFVRQTLAAA